MPTRQQLIDEDQYFVVTEIVTLICFLCLLTYHSAAIYLHRKQSSNGRVTGGKILLFGYEIDIRHISVAVLVFDVLSTIFCIAVYSSYQNTLLRCKALGGLENCLALSGKYFGYLFIILRARFDDSYFTITKARISYAVVLFFGVYFLIWGIVGSILKHPYVISFMDGACSYSSESALGIIYIAQYVVVDFIFSIYFYMQFIQPLKQLREKAKDQYKVSVERLISKVTKYTTFMLIVTPLSWILMFVVLSSSSQKAVNLTPIFPGIDAVLHAFCIIKQFERENLRVFRYMFSFICPCIISNEDSYILEEKMVAQKEEEISAKSGSAHAISLASGLFLGIATEDLKKDVKNNASYNNVQSPTGDSANPSSNDNNNQQVTVGATIQVDIVGQNATQNT